MEHNIDGYAAYNGLNGAVIHPKAKGAVYNDPAYPNTVAAAKTPDQDLRLPEHADRPDRSDPLGFGAWDYMFIASTDIEDGLTAGADSPVGTRPFSAARRAAQSIPGMLTCGQGRPVGAVPDGTSNTILVHRGRRAGPPDRRHVRQSFEPPVADRC